MVLSADIVIFVPAFSLSCLTLSILPQKCARPRSFRKFWSPLAVTVIVSGLGAFSAVTFTVVVPGDTPCIVHEVHSELGVAVAIDVSPTEYDRRFAYVAVDVTVTVSPCATVTVDCPQ